MTQIIFNKIETSIIGSILSQKMGYELPLEFKGTELVGMISGNERSIVHWIKKINPETVKKLGLADAIISIESKFKSGGEIA